ncbi:MAG TPA: hypothetical protein VGD50_02680 [Candidatus Baltobacteraceae bacterium]
MSLTLVLVILLLIAVIAIMLWAMRGVTAADVVYDGVVTPSRVSANARDVLNDPPRTVSLTMITWPYMLDEESGELSVEGRYDLVQRLGVIADDWTTPILRQAVHEESDPRILDAVVDALVSKKLQ